MNAPVQARTYFKGMGEAVADRTVNRRIFTDEQKAAVGNTLTINPEDPKFNAWANAAILSGVEVETDTQAAFHTFSPELRSETWADVSERVAHGNVTLTDDDGFGGPEFKKMRDHLRKGALLMSGRHLQHGDANQKNRPMEVFTNCSSAAANFLLFYLLLNGSGVGRAYDNQMMKVDYAKMPTVHVVIDKNYPDRQKMQMEWDGIAQAMVNVPMIPTSFSSADEISDALTGPVTWFDVPDSRGGWAKCLEIIETMTYEERSNETLVLDFSDVRPNGSPIRGMQNRPSSGPAALMKAIVSISALKGNNMEPWESTMFADHYAAECVLVGGARRAARMATKTWRDANIFGFISIKKHHGLWSSNNSVTIDEEFRERCVYVRGLLDAHTLAPTEANTLLAMGLIDEIDAHAWKVLYALADASYHDGTGEPGIINQDRLNESRVGVDDYLDGLFAGSKDYQVDPGTRPLLTELARAVVDARYTMITNPCGEIALLMLGAYCVIADVVPFHSDDDADAEDAFRVAVRALMRTNTMDSLYNREVTRTNRIGVGLTGFHEWAYKRFGFTWHDLVNEAKSMELWLMMSHFRRAVSDEAISFAEVLGVNVPHTNTTFKPAGTTSKLFGLTEGAHLPSMRWFLRWVQFRNDDPLIATYREKGYPVRQLTTYAGTTIVGFPTAPTICEMDGGDWVVTAAEATPEEQYRFLQLLEKYWINGVEADGVTPFGRDEGNQISYTLKYNPQIVDFGKFMSTLIDGQFTIRCCSVMPQEQTDLESSPYEYLPEEPISREKYEELIAVVRAGEMLKEGIGFEHIDCSTGACPVDFDEEFEEEAAV